MNHDEKPSSGSQPQPVVINLSGADWDQFTDALDTPPPPNDELQALMSKPWADGKSFEVEE